MLRFLFKLLVFTLLIFVICYAFETRTKYLFKPYPEVLAQSDIDGGNGWSSDGVFGNGITEWNRDMWWSGGGGGPATDGGYGGLDGGYDGGYGGGGDGGYGGGGDDGGYGGGTVVDSSGPNWISANPVPCQIPAGGSVCSAVYISYAYPSCDLNQPGYSVAISTQGGGPGYWFYQGSQKATGTTPLVANFIGTTPITFS